MDLFVIIKVKRKNYGGVLITLIFKMKTKTSLYQIASMLLPKSKLRTRLNQKYYSWLSALAVSFEIFFINFIEIKLYKTFWTKRPDYQEMIKEYTRTYKIKPGDVIIDAGAHHGAFTIYAAKKAGESGLVIAIEPEEHNFRLLQKKHCLKWLKKCDSNQICPIFTTTTNLF